MEMNNDKEGHQEWFIFSFSTRIFVHSSFTHSQAQLPLH